ncbi:sigma factor-like helix-turn-helix DNA-binding protein [Nocardioides sp. NPDC059952]|uniref:sigma factor-like helix-turn-helix DNA-binding protein n=1 Tax=Nocardioides sp. NPDC059952 TaxID=3347014 RepID=UPI00364BB260
MTDFTLFDLGDRQPRRWADAFPWLPGLSPDWDADSWLAADAHETDLGEWDARVTQVATMAAERLTNWTIGQIFPGLPPDLNLLKSNLPTRAINAVMRRAPTADALSQYRLQDVLDWQGVGAGTVHAVLEVLVAVSLDASTPNIEVESDHTAPTSAGVDQGVVPEWIRDLISDLTEVAEWHVVVGRQDAALLDPDTLPAETPQRVKEAQHRLARLTVHNVIEEHDADADAAARLDDAFAVLDPRAVQVLAQRVFADRPATLEELGRSFGVTRERIRQIEAKASGAILNAITQDSVLADLAAVARQVIGTIRPLDELLLCIPALGRTVESVLQPAWRVLDRLDNAYEIDDAWCVAPSKTAAVTATETQLEERTNGHGVARLEDLDLVRTADPTRRSAVNASWLAHCGYVVDGDFVLTRTSSVGDYAAAVLAIAGSPLSVQEIVDRFVVDRTPGATRNAMSIDDRFERVDRDRWALTEWGLGAYAGIRSVIREQVAQGGGRVKLSDLVEYITARYSVSGSSVAAYAGAQPFATKNGFVQLATEDRGARKAPERTRRLFRQADGWAYRVGISTDHLRGSGSVAPHAIATILEMRAGETRHLDSPLGPQSVAWTGLQPQFGTIRRFLMAEDVAAGTEAFLVLRDDGTFAFELARDLMDNPVADALSLAACPSIVDRAEARLALARALKLPDDSPVTSIIGGYRARGDDDIAELLTSAREYLETGHELAGQKYGADIDDILDLL